MTVLHSAKFSKLDGSFLWEALKVQILTIWLDLYSLWFKENLPIIIEEINNQPHVWIFPICRFKWHFYMQIVQDEDDVTDLKQAYIRKHTKEEFNKIWNIWPMSYRKHSYTNVLFMTKV